MYTTARPWMIAVKHVASTVETLPQTLFSRVRAVTHQTVRPVKTRAPQHRGAGTVPQATTPYVMLVASDITDKGYGLFS
jgi:hypothetical protein